MSPNELQMVKTTLKNLAVTEKRDFKVGQTCQNSVLPQRAVWSLR